MPPKKHLTDVIDLTDDPVEVEDLVEAFSTQSTSSSSDVAIIRTLVDNGLTTPLPLPLPPLQITSSPLPPKNRHTRISRNNNNNLIASDDVTVLKTVTHRKKTLKSLSANPITVIPSDTPLPPNPTITERKCPVCFDVIKNPSVTLCGHVYCTECIKAAVGAAKQCPICRKKLTSKGFHPLYL